MCVFCEIASHQLTAHTIYENERVMAFLDSAPINLGHILIIPKTHYLDADEVPNDLLHELMDVSKQIICAIKETFKPDGYSMMQNGGQFNDIGHYHLHVFPRYQNDGFGWISSENPYEVSENIATKIRANLQLSDL